MFDSKRVRVRVRVLPLAGGEGDHTIELVHVDGLRVDVPHGGFLAPFDPGLRQSLVHLSTRGVGLGVGVEAGTGVGLRVTVTAEIG